MGDGSNLQVFFTRCAALANHSFGWSDSTTHLPRGYSLAAPGFSTTTPALPLNAVATDASESANARSNAPAFSQEFTPSTIHSGSPCTCCRRVLPPDPAISSDCSIGRVTPPVARAIPYWLCNHAGHIAPANLRCPFKIQSHRASLGRHDPKQEPGPEQSPETRAVILTKPRNKNVILRKTPKQELSSLAKPRNKNCHPERSRRICGCFFLRQSATK